MYSCSQLVLAELRAILTQVLLCVCFHAVKHAHFVVILMKCNDKCVNLPKH